MSYFVIQVGHCGNLLGHSFFSTLAEISSKKRNSKNLEFLDKSDSRFFSYNEKEDKKCAHAILLDTKSQVIQHVTKPTKDSWCYDTNCNKLFKPELLSCWPLGHEVQGPSLKEFILDAVRREVECYDQFYGFLLFGSISGSTSSGVISYITKLLRDEFPSVSLTNVSVWPYQIGGSAVYNATLNLSTLQNFSDAIFLLENDNFMKLCLQKLGMKGASLDDYNLIASHQLANLFLPVDNYCSTYPTLNDMLSVLVPHPQFKIISLHSVPHQPLSSSPFCSFDWPTLLRSLRKMLLYSTDSNEVYGHHRNLPSSISSQPVTLTNLLILRGRDCKSADINNFHKPQFPYASWVPRSSRMNIWTHSNPILSYEKTALLANNGQLSVNCINKLSENAWNYFEHKYYFHYFKEYGGLAEDDFHSSLLDVQQIVSSYKSLKT